MSSCATKVDKVSVTMASNSNLEGVVPIASFSPLEASQRLSNISTSSSCLSNKIKPLYNMDGSSKTPDNHCGPTDGGCNSSPTSSHCSSISVGKYDVEPPAGVGIQNRKMSPSDVTIKKPLKIFTPKPESTSTSASTPNGFPELQPNQAYVTSVLFTLRWRLMSQILLALPVVGIFICLITSVIFHADHINNTICKVR